MNRFRAITAVGRVNTGGRKLPLMAAIDASVGAMHNNTTVIRCMNTDGFRVAVRIPLGEQPQEDEYELNATDVECTLADGTVVECTGTWRTEEGRIRLDAVSDDLHWFWLEVRPA